MASAQSHLDNQPQAMAEQGKDQVQDFKEQLSKKTEELTEKASGICAEMKEVLNHAGHNIQEQSEHLYETMEKYVKENPIKALGMAAVGGSLLAIILAKMLD